MTTFAKTGVMIGAVVLLSVLLPVPAVAGNGEALLPYAPKRTMAVFSIDVDRLTNSPLYKDITAALTSQPATNEVLDQLREDANFDLQKDLHTVVMLFPDDIQTSQDYVMLLDADVDADKILAMASTQGYSLSESKAGDHTIYFADSRVALAFDGSTLLFGTLAMVEDTLVGDKIGKRETVSTLLETVDKEKDAWFVFDIPDSFQTPTGHRPDQDLESIFASIDLQDGLDLALSGNIASESAAKELLKLFESQQVVIAQEPAMKLTGLDVAFEKMKATRAGKRMDVELHLSQEELDQIIGSITQLF